MHAFDINKAFVANARAIARKVGVGETVTAHESDGTKLPLLHGRVDRLTTRNALIYQVVTRPDPEGRLLPMVRTIAQHARDGGDISGEKIDEIVSTLENAVAEKNYLLLAPQFLVTGRR